MQSILEILQELHISYKVYGQDHHATLGWVQIECPYCGKDSNVYHCGVPLNGKPIANCWKCGSHSVVNTLSEYTGKGKSYISDLLKDILYAVPTNDEIIKGRLILPQGLGNLSKAHKKYLEDRGFVDPDFIIKLWRLQGIGIASKLPWRIFIPVILYNKIVSWTTRTISTIVEPRYINASPEQEAMRLKSLLFGEDLARNSIVITEGPFDAINVGPGAVATFGTSFTRSQVKRLLKYPLRFVIFDSSPIAQERAKELTNILSCFPGRTSRIEIDAKDPGSATKKEVELIRKHFLE